MKSKPIKVLHFHLCIIPYACDFPKALKLQLSACGRTCILVVGIFKSAHVFAAVTAQVTVKAVRCILQDPIFVGKRVKALWP